jgi:hypothetical protein
MGWQGIDLAPRQRSFDVHFDPVCALFIRAKHYFRS